MIPNFVLYRKKEAMMRAALAYVEELRDHHAPLLRAANMHELRLAHETRNMILPAEMKLRASLWRTESRCSHYRIDYPDMDEENWNAWINIRKAADGSMQLEKQRSTAGPPARGPDNHPHRPAPGCPRVPCTGAFLLGASAPAPA